MSTLETNSRLPVSMLRSPTIVLAPTRALADLDAKQAGLLALLQSDDSHREMLTSMMVSNTLMELTKLSWARLGMGEFASATLSTLAQCTPLIGCALVFEAPGLPPVHCTLGDWPSPEKHEAEFLTRQGTPREMYLCPIYGNDGTSAIGYLGGSGVNVSLIEAGLLERAADFLTSTLSLLIEAEYLRRSAAASKVMDLIASLTDDYEESDLVEVVSIIQTLPGAVGASLLLEVRRFAGPLEVSAGLFPDGGTSTEMTEVIDRSGSCTLKVSWGNASAPDDNRLADVGERLFSFLTRVEQTSRLLAEVETDELTGIGNRRRASKALAQASARARRTGEEYSILLMDLDRFKTVNDKLGHEVGDLVLRSFSNAIEQVIRGYDVASRWGGEEFLLVCPSTGQAGAEALATRLLRDTPVLCGRVLPEDWHQTVSIGITVCQNAALDPIELVRTADAAMYEAKTSGRNRFVFAHTKSRNSK